MKPTAKKAKAVFAFIASMTVAAILLAGVGYFLWEYTVPQAGSARRIILEDTIEVYPDQTFRVSPVYIDENNEIAAGDFAFTLEPSVGEDGKPEEVLEKGPSDGEYTVKAYSEHPQKISVTERRSGLTAAVQIKILRGELAEIGEVVAEEGNALFGDEIAFRVSVYPKESLVKDEHLSFEVYDGHGMPVSDALQYISVTDNRIIFRAAGIGSGSVKFTFRNPVRNLFTEKTVSFSEHLESEALNEAVLTAGGAEGGLLGAEALGNISEIGLFSLKNAPDLSPLKEATPNLKGIRLEDESELLPASAKPDAAYTYYIPEARLSAYYEAWGEEEFLEVLPMDASEAEGRKRCVILHPGYRSAGHADAEPYYCDTEALGTLDDLVHGYDFLGWYTGMEDGEKVDALPAAAAHLFAHWDCHTYTLTFDATGANKDVASVEVKYLDPFPALPTPEFATWTLEGWYFGGEKIEAGASYAWPQDIELVAKWKGTLTLNDNLNKTDGTMSAIWGEALAPAAPSKPAGQTWEFKGWFMDEARTDAVASPYKGAGNATLYARWEGTLHFFDNLGVTSEGEAKQTDCTVVLGLKPTLPAEPAASDGWTFKGWASDQNRRETLLSASENYDGANGANFFSRWEGTLHFSDNLNCTDAEAPEEVTDVSVVRGVSFTLPDRADARGWTFNGWFTNRSNDGTKLESKAYYGAGNATYYSLWRGTLTLSDGLNNNDRHTAPVVKGLRLSVTYRPDPDTQKGWTFNGWAKDEEFGSKDVSTDVWNGDGTAYLYAIWTGTLTLDYSGLIGNGSLPVRHGAKPALPGHVPQDGWTFEYWCTDATRATKVNDSDPYRGSGNATLYSRWEGGLTLVDALNDTRKTVTPVKALPLNETPTTAHRGWTFGGWYTAPDSPATYRPGEPYTGSGDATLTACWMATISLDYSGITAKATTHTVYYGRAVKTSGALPVPNAPANWTFDGWHTEETTSADKYTDAALFNVKEAEGFTLHAVFTGTITLTGGEDVREDVTVTLHSSLGGYLNSSYLTKFCRAGYHFDRWTSDGGEPLTIQSGTTADVAFAGRTFRPAYEANAYTVLYQDADGGELTGFGEREVRCTYSADGYKPSGTIPVKKGNFFLGWKIAEGIVYGDPSTLYTKDDTLNWTPEQDVTIVLRAQWSVVTFSVTYTDDSNTKELAPAEVEYAQGEYLIPEDLTPRPGYYFAGWAFNGHTYQAGESVLEVLQNYFDAQPTSFESARIAVTLSAQWTAIDVNVRWYKNRMGENSEIETYTAETLETLKPIAVSAETGYLFMNSWRVEGGETVITAQEGKELNERLIDYIEGLEEFRSPKSAQALAIGFRACFDPVTFTVRYIDGSATIEQEYSFDKINGPEAVSVCLLSATDLADLGERDTTGFKQAVDGTVVAAWVINTVHYPIENEGGQDIKSLLVGLAEAEPAKAAHVLSVTADRKKVRITIHQDRKAPGIEIADETVEWGDTVALVSVPERDGYRFQSWKLTSVAVMGTQLIDPAHYGYDGETEFAGGQQIMSLIQTNLAVVGKNTFPTFTINFEAQWVEQVFRIYLPAEEGASVTEYTEVAYSSAESYMLPLPEKKGYAFRYWLADWSMMEGGQREQFGDPGEQFSDGDAEFYLALREYATKHRTTDLFLIYFYPVWEEKTFTLKRAEMDEGLRDYMGFEETSEEVTYSGLTEFLLETASHEGFIFNGWKSSYGPDGLAKTEGIDVAAAIKEYIDGENFRKIGAGVENGFDSPESAHLTITFTRDWTEKTVTLTKDYAFAEDENNTQYTYRQFCALEDWTLSPEVKEGYFFVKWSLTSDGSTTLDGRSEFVACSIHDTNGFVIGAAEDLKQAILDVLEAADETPAYSYVFRASMEEQVFSVTLERGDTEGTQTFELKYSAQDMGGSYSLPELTNVGFAFGGWDAVCTVGEDSEEAHFGRKGAVLATLQSWVSADYAAYPVTFTAKWTEKQVKVTMDGHVAGREDLGTKTEGTYNYSRLLEEGFDSLFANPEVAGYRFIGWKTKMGVTVYNQNSANGPAEALKELLAYLTDEEKNPGCYEKTSFEVLFTADWQAGGISVTFSYLNKGDRDEGNEYKSINDVYKTDIASLRALGEDDPLKSLPGFTSGQEEFRISTRQGYYFAGWKLSVNGEPKGTVFQPKERLSGEDNGVIEAIVEVIEGAGSEHEIALEVLFEAVWQARELTVTFEEGEREPATLTYGSLPKEWKLPKPAPKTGQYLASWTVAFGNGSASSITIDEGDDQCEKDYLSGLTEYLEGLRGDYVEQEDSPVSLGVKFTAVWAEKTVSVTFDFNDPSLEKTTQSWLYSAVPTEGFALPAVQPRTGYSHSGEWQLDKNGTLYPTSANMLDLRNAVMPLAAEDRTVTNRTFAVTFTAQRFANYATVRYETGYGAGGPTETNMDVTYERTEREEAITIDAPAPRAGYYFGGWEVTFADGTLSQTVSDVGGDFKAILKDYLSLPAQEGAAAHKKGDVTIRVKWVAVSVTVTYDLSPSGSTSRQTFNFDSFNFSLPGVPVTGQYYYDRTWTCDERSYPQSDINAFVTEYVISLTQNNLATRTASLTFHAAHAEKTATLTFTGKQGTSVVYTGTQDGVKYSGSFTFPSLTPSTGYHYGDWTAEGLTGSWADGASASAMAAVRTKLSGTNAATTTINFTKTQSKNFYTVTLKAGSQSDDIAIGWDNNHTDKGARSWEYDATVSLKFPQTSGHTRYLTVTSGTSVSFTYNTNDVTFKMPASSITIEYGCSTDHGGCFTAGSLITMADGSLKPVEDIEVGEEVMVFDHFAGQFSAAPTCYIFYLGRLNATILRANFSDGSYVDIYDGHGFLDREARKYITLRANNIADYIGHEFLHVDMAGGVPEAEWVKLTSFEVFTEETEVYSIVSAVHINHIVNGMLAVTDDIEGLYDIFDLDENMKVDEAKMQADIERYGLYTYEDWADYVTYEQFVAFNGAYLKVAIGKGITTYEGILGLIQTFLQ